MWTLAFSRDNRRLAAAGADGGVWLFDSATLRPLRRYETRADWAWSVAFSPDGSRLAAAGDRGVVYLWELDSGALRELARDLPVLHAVAFHPDGGLLAVAGHDGSARGYEVATGRLAYTAGGADGVLRGLAFSPDGRYLAAACANGTVHLWSAGTGEPVRTLSSELTRAEAVRFVDDDRLVVTGRTSREEAWLTWRLSDGVVVERHTEAIDYETPGRGVTGYSPDGRFSAFAWGHSLTVYGDGAQLAEAELTGGDPVTGVAVNAAGDRVVACGAPRSTRPGLWIGPIRLADPGVELRAVAMDPAGDRVAAVDERGGVYLWDVDADRPPRVFPAGKWVYSLAFSRDGAELAALGGDGIRRWRTDDGTPLDPPVLRDPQTGRPHHPGAWPRIGYAADGALLTAAGDNNGVDVWRDGRHWYFPARETSGPHSRPVAFDPDGWLVAVGVDGAVLRFDLTTGQSRTPLTGMRGLVRALAFSPEGDRLFVAGDDRLIRIFTTATGKETASGGLVAELAGHVDVVTGLAAGPGGLLVSCGLDGVRVWRGQREVTSGPGRAG
jgi:WD40 repeat protein